MKPPRPFLKTNLFACLLAFAAMATFAGLVWVKIKPINTNISGHPQPERPSHSSRESSQADGTTTPKDYHYIKPGEIFPLKRMVEDCDTLPRGETSVLCYDRVKKCGFLLTGQRVVRQITAPPSPRDVAVEHVDADGNRTTRRLSPTYSRVDFAQVLVTYYDAEGKKSDVPVRIERPEIFKTEKQPKFNWDDMRKY